MNFPHIAFSSGDWALRTKIKALQYREKRVAHTYICIYTVVKLFSLFSLLYSRFYIGWRRTGWETRAEKRRQRGSKREKWEGEIKVEVARGRSVAASSTFISSFHTPTPSHIAHIDNTYTYTFSFPLSRFLLVYILVAMTDTNKRFAFGIGSRKRQFSPPIRMSFPTIALLLSSPTLFKYIHTYKPSSPLFLHNFLIAIPLFFGWSLSRRDLRHQTNISTDIETNVSGRAFRWIDRDENFMISQDWERYLYINIYVFMYI